MPVAGRRHASFGSCGAKAQELDLAIAVGTWTSQQKKRRTKASGFNREDYLEYAVAAVSERLYPVFSVSEQALRKRIQKDGLDALL